MSRNGKYYTKRLGKTTYTSNQRRIDIIFKTSNSSVTSSDVDTVQCVENENESSGTEPRTFTASCDSEFNDTPFESPFIATAIPGNVDTVTTPDPVHNIDTVTTHGPIECPTTKTHAKRSYKRPLSVNYEADYEWLYYSSAKKAYVCKTCELFREASSQSIDFPFVTGTQLGDHPVRKLYKHQISKPHEAAVSRYIKFKCGSFSASGPLPIALKTTDG